MFFAFVSNSQIQNNSVNTIEEINEPSLEEESDSVQVELDVIEQETIKAKKSKINKSKEKSTRSEGYSYDLDAQSQQQQKMVVVSEEFSYTKNKAATQRTQRTPSSSQQQQMIDAVGYFEKNAPNSFEFHYFKYVSGNYDISEIEHLREAEQLRPNNSDVHTQMAAYNIILNEKDAALVYLEKLISSKKITPSVLSYAKDLLLSVPENGVLITHGFDDSYAAWYLQNKKKIRADVSLISLDFLQSNDYRTKIKSDGYKLPTSKIINVDYLKEFCSSNANKNISISLTAPKEYFVPIKNNLYVVGLVFEYHENEFNNFYRNDYLWNEALTKELVSNAIDEKAKQLSANYLPMLLQLRNVYQQKKDELKLKDVNEASDHVGVQCNKYEQVQKIKGAY